MNELLTELITTLPESPTVLDDTNVKKYINISRYRLIIKFYGPTLRVMESIRQVLFLRIVHSLLNLHGKR